MSKIMELADHYAICNAVDGDGVTTHKRTDEARAALQEEVEMLEADVDAKADIAHRALDERDALRKKLTYAQTANNLLDKALLASHPLGAEGILYEYWNEARKFMEATK